MAQDNKVVSFQDRKPAGQFSLPPALIRLRDTSGRELKSVLNEFFDRSDDALFELADRAGNEHGQLAYFDAMRELRLRRKSISVSILQYVSRAFNEIGRFRPHVAQGDLEEIDHDNLSLMDHGELEQQVAIDNLVNKLRNRYADAIRLLTVRVNHLVADIELSDSQMPLSPEVICGGVSEACADLDIDIRAKLVVLKLFDKLLVGILANFYQDANKTLIDEGVLPDMKRPPVGKSSPPSAGKSSGSAQGQAAAGGEEGAGATFSELSALLRQGDESSRAEVGQSGVAFLDTDGLMSKLSQVQVQVVSWEVDQVVPLREQILLVLKTDEGKPLQVGQMDNDVINLVSMLFDFILEDRQLHAVMKALIARLQIPVLKVALSDPNFFNRGGHPVRKLLNDMALSAIGWTEKRPGQRDPFREKIEYIVDRILNEFTTNVSLFEELLQDFSHFMDLDRRRRELVEQRLRDAEEGRARQERANEMADTMVSGVVSNRQIPEQVLALLEQPWTRYLQWVFLRQGEQSEAWKAAQEFTERLVWSVDPRPITETTRSELLRAIPAIVDEFRKAMQEISWDPFATDSAIRDLELAHVDVFQRLVTAVPQPEAPAGAPEAAPEEPLADAGLADAAAVSDEDSGIEAEWLARADSLRVGSWIELNRDDNRIRCKLAAFIKATGKYIFVNRSGAKVAEYPREQLARAMAAGEIGMLDDGLIFDRALESIIDNLRSSRKD
ncbi:DUF1631 domain-containing protein [Marinobacter pelagius]|uniref:DUF1631 domain-containing protein n=1 Tax=Marinobacter sp. C7 TaxID=2951363 RepID=UPI001EEFFC96|nr:DUF1631 domain-containing protein [Marinobacter sp. C7]MCG7199988.1 DUF1631 domain-containing protein [Marinobacter sp. C7]